MSAQCSQISSICVKELHLKTLIYLFFYKKIKNNNLVFQNGKLSYISRFVQRKYGMFVRTNASPHVLNYI